MKPALVALAAALAISCAGALVSHAGETRKCACGAGAAPTGVGSWDGSPVVRTRFGRVQGFPDQDDTWVWKAVPFAAPPLGELRWRAPREPAPWTGIRAKRSFGERCTQLNPVVGGIRGSEDCLTLNIWRPRTAQTGLPVYVWIHGGGNSIGSSVMVNEYRGNRLAHASGFVFVSINYRLGPFGWFTLPALREGVSAEDDSGNYGTLDIIQALHWIRDNIVGFGGDPGLVAVTGESAGAANVLSLMISPLAEGLFHRAVSQSAPGSTKDLSEGESRSERVLWQLLLDDRKARTVEQATAVAATMSPKEIRGYLRSKSDRQIMRCYAASSSMGMVDNPSLLRDGYVIPADGMDALTRSPTAAKVPLLIGGNREELKLFLAFDRRLSWKSELAAAVARYGSMRWKAGGVDAVARRIADRGDAPPVHAYEFAWGAPDETGASVMPGSWGRRLGAFHSLEIPFFLGHDTLNVALHHLVFSAGNRPGRKALSEAMMDYAASFVRTGDPNRLGSGLPAWQAWSNEPGAAKCLVLDADAGAARISMSVVEQTEAGVFESLDRDLDASLAAKTRQRLEQSHYPSASR